MKLTIEIPDNENVSICEVRNALHTYFCYSKDFTVTPAEPTARELLQAWKDGCNLYCSIDHRENEFPCKCLCAIQHTDWDIDKVIETYKKECEK